MGGTMAVAMCLRPSRPLKGESGCMEMQRMAGLSSRRRRVVPMKVPLVPRPATKWVTLAFGLLPDLVGGGVVVGEPVVVVGVLVGVEVLLGLGGGELAGLADGAVGAVGGVGPDDCWRRRRARMRLRSGETFEGMQRVTGKPSAAPSMA